MMSFEEAVTFLGRLGVCPTNDVTANVAAVLTAAIDPGGVGALVDGDANVAVGMLCGKRKKCEDIATAERMMVVNVNDAATEKVLLESRT